MLRFSPICFLLAGLVACGPARSDRPLTQPAPELPSSPITLSIVGTNDLHGGIVPRDGKGGLALFGGYVNNLRAARAKDGAVLLLDGGDIFQGTLESNLGEGATTLAAYNALGYTAAAVGNHEFDFGPIGPAVTPKQPGDDPRGGPVPGGRRLWSQRVAGERVATDRRNGNSQRDRAAKNLPDGPVGLRLK